MSDINSNLITEDTLERRKRAVCRTFLQYETEYSTNDYSTNFELVFFRIRGISNFWISHNINDFNILMSDIITSLYRNENIFSYALVSNKNEICLYIGGSSNIYNSIEASFRASYQLIEIERVESRKVFNDIKAISNYGGVVTGNPTRKSNGEESIFQIEKLCKGMFGESWSFVVVCSALGQNQINFSHTKILNELNEINNGLKSSINMGILGNQVVERQNFLFQDYFQILQQMEVKMLEAKSRGAWRTSVYYSAEDNVTKDRIKNILKSIFSGEESKPEPIKCNDVRNIKNIIGSIGFINDLSPYISSHIFGNLNQENIMVPTIAYKYQNILTSDEVATFCQLPKIEVPGYYIDNFVEFDVAPRRSDGELVVGNIINGSNELNNRYTMDLDDLTRHGIIIGITGGGKTNTSKSLLRSLFNINRKPFLVIESAKREYWQLKNINGFEDLAIFTLGSEGNNSIPYRINPFEVVGNVPLQTHIDYLLSAFKASFDLFPPLPYILESSVYEIYEDRGWDILRNINVLGREDYPTLEDLYYKIEVVIDRLGYHKEVKSNTKAALQARIGSLRVGGKGAMLDTPTSVPINVLLNGPTVMELEDIGDDDVKSFVIGIILVQLYEYRKSNISKVDGLEHVLLIEEAHRLLMNVSGVGGENSNPRAKSVEFFCNLLAEIRSYGQGILIADQIPTKLASDTLKNTNLKIVHRTVMEEDREVVGKAMNMTDEQIKYLSSLRRGVAAIYSEGDNRPKLVKMPLVKEDYNFSREYVIRDVRKNVISSIGNYYNKLNYTTACNLCLSKCNYFNKIESLKNKGILDDKKLKFLADKLKAKSCSINAIDALFQYLEEKVLEEKNTNLNICILGFILSKLEISKAQQREIIIQFINRDNRIVTGR